MCAAKHLSCTAKSQGGSALRGSALLTVIICSTVAAITAASVLSLMSTQRTLALRKELEMHAVNATESSIDYAYSLLIKKIGTGASFDIVKIR
ncbi:MAG: hypothetical protein J6386_09740 [Candidatus Synoicihabitans palmerolidicus]|nr:hypothetical protein [Candidatus Synoicihabitans palmerolidicus]